MYSDRVLTRALGVCIGIALCCTFGMSQRRPHNAPVTVRVEHSGGRLIYTVNSQQVAPADSLRVIGDAMRKRGPQTAVVVFVDEQISFERLENLKGVILKAGSSNVRYFVVGSDKSLMQEVHFDKAIPYSLTIE